MDSTPKTIRFLNLSVDPSARARYLAAIDGILASGVIVNGPEVDRFERQTAAYCGVSDAVGVGSGTAALYLALKCLDIKPGDEIILPALSFVGTANAIAAVGARPVFVDIRPDLLIDPKAVEPAITPRTRAIMPVHFTGNVCDMDALRAISEKRSILIVEDAAPAFGASYNNRKVGTFGPLGCISANPMKVLGGLGEAGIILAQSASHAGRLRELRYHGIRDKELCMEVSVNERLDTIQAAILSIRLEGIEDRLNRREQIARRYATQLSKVAEVPKPAPHVRHAWYHYTILCDRRDELGKALALKGIETRSYHTKLMPQHPAHAQAIDRFPVGRCVIDRILCLPMHDKLSDEEVDRVSAAIIEFYGSS
jgi:dTDP-4-amino-4,6-dideoxygalactose transaminase